MLRPEYWTRSKDLLAWCEPEELQILSKQAQKALNERMDAYLGKLEAKDRAKKKAKAKKLKTTMINN